MAEAVTLTDEGNQRKDLILRNLKEALGTDKLTKQISTNKNIHLYWGTAPTGKPHVGYMVPMQKIADFLHAGVKVTILFADMHAFLDNMKSTLDVLQARVQYYEYVIKALLASLDVPLDQLHFVRGIDYQLLPAYTQDMLRLCGQISQRDASRAGAEVVKQIGDPLLSGLLYPLLQAVDEQHLKVDGQFGGVDQRKIFILAEEQLPKVKLGKRWHLMNHMVPGLTGGKMSSSELDSKIDLLDPPEIIAKKIDNSVCEKPAEGSDGNLEDNGVLCFLRFVVMPIVQPNPFCIGGKNFSNYEEIEASFKQADGLTPQQLKDALKEFLIDVLTKVHQRCQTDELSQIMEKAYPTSIDDSKVGIEEDLESLQLNDSTSAVLDTIKGNNKLLESVKLRKRLQSGSPVRVLWRVSTKGHVNLAHIIGLLQLKRLQALGCECSILISDLGGYLDNNKCPWAAMGRRVEYYEKALGFMMAAIDLKNVSFRQSSALQYERQYTLDMYTMASKITREASAVVTGNTLATHLCPIYYTLDLHYADVDLVITGENETPLVSLAQQLSKALKFANPGFMLFPTLMGTDSKRMSSSNEAFHLDPRDTPKVIKAKISKSFCEPANLEGNTTLELARHVIFPLQNDQDLVIERPEEYGGNVILPDYKTLETMFVEEKLHPADLKPIVIAKVNSLLDPVRKNLAPHENLIKSAFPKK